MRVRFTNRWEDKKPGDRADVSPDVARKLIARKVAMQDMARDPQSVKTHQETGDQTTKLANRNGR